MTSEFELTHQALDAAETMLRCLPQVSTNAKGTKPNMTTTEALKLVRAALAQEHTSEPCKNPDCDEGKIYMYADQIADCPNCQGTGREPEATGE